MKSQILAIFYFLISLIISSSITAQSTIFEDITLARPLPEVFLAGEIYTLKGRINNFEGEAKISAHINLVNGEYHKISTVMCRDGIFSLNLDFKFPGVYYLTLSVNHQLKGSQIVKVVNPIHIEPKPLRPIINFGTSTLDFKVKLSWQTENELIQLQILQDSLENTYTVTNNPQEYELHSNDFFNFKQGEVTLRIRGARSADGSWFTQCSDWSEWQTIERTLVENLSYSKSPSVNFRQPYCCTGKVDSTFAIDLQVRVNYEPQAYIIRPDGWVDKIKLKSEQKLKSYTVGKSIQEWYPPGNCILEYTPNSIGTYIIEINDAFGKALLNIPFYCGDVLPLLPERKLVPDTTFNVDSARTNMLHQINSLRGQLGLQPLRLDSILTGFSQYYSARMAREKFCGHVAPDGEDLQDRRRRFSIVTPITENVAKASSVAEAFHNLLRSPSHYASMIDSTVTRVGIGITKDDENYFLVAQHFAGEPLTQKEREQFITYLFEKMKSIRPELRRIDQPANWPALRSTEYRAMTLGRLEEMVLGDNSYTTWRLRNVGEIYFESFTQTVDGLNLTINYYPWVKKEDTVKK